MHSNNSLFYNALLPLLDYTDSRAITSRARVELYQMLVEDKKRTAHKAVVTRVLEGDGRAARRIR